MHNHYLQFGNELGNGALLFPTLSFRSHLNTEPKVAHDHPLNRDPESFMNTKFKPKYFEDENYMTVDDVKQLTTFESNYLHIGEVIMVRSANVPEMGDHFAVISGPLENKEHGVRPQTISICTSPNGIQMLDLFEPLNGVIILQLSPDMRDKFHAFHGAKVVGREIQCLISKTA